MTSEKYCEMLEKWFPKAIEELGIPSTSHTTAYLIQDHERAINTLAAKAVMHDLKIKMPPFPKSSPDLNPIENLWIYIRKFMNATQPPRLEKRYQVVKRLARAVRHVNTVHCGTVENVCDSMRERCRDVIKNKGGYINY
jgi:hypothetical protein